MPEFGSTPSGFTFSALSPTGSMVKPKTQAQQQQQQAKKLTLDEQWGQWNKTKNPQDLKNLMTELDPIINKAITSYAPNSSPAVRSQARILARKALTNYDPKKGTKLQTYLHIQLQPLQREAGTYDTLHIPEAVRYDIRDVNDAHNRFVEENGREPNDDELSDYTGLSSRRITRIRRADRNVFSEGQLTPYDDDSDEGAVDLPAVRQADSAWQGMVYTELNERDKLIYDLRTGRNGRGRALSVTEIAKKLKVSPAAISQRLKLISDRIAEGAEYADQI